MIGDSDPGFRMGRRQPPHPGESAVLEIESENECLTGGKTADRPWSFCKIMSSLSYCFHRKHRYCYHPSLLCDKNDCCRAPSKAITSRLLHAYINVRSSPIRSCAIIVGFLTLIVLLKIVLFFIPPPLETIDPKIFSPSQSVIDSDLSVLNRVVYLVWIGTSPLRPVGLASIDSIARHLPRWKIEVHFTKEVDIPDGLFETRKRYIDRQIDYFKERSVNITSVIHDDIENEVKGTMFDGLGLKQKHIAGVFGLKSHWTFGGHASDFLRLFLTVPNGGMYMDEDNIVLKDLEPLFERYGPTIVVAGDLNETIPSCEERWPQNCWYAQAPNHPLFIDTVRRVRGTILQKGLECAFRYDADTWLPGWNGHDVCFWTLIGPRRLAHAHLNLCKINPPEIVNELPDDLLNPTIPMNSSIVPSNASHDQHQHHPRKLYTFMSRKYLMQGHWEEPNFLIDAGDDINERLAKLSTAYQFHIYGNLKYDFLKFLDDSSPTHYPVLHYVHQSSCIHLCNPRDYVPLVSF